MSQETIWVLEIDGSPAVSSLEEIDAMLGTVAESIAQVVAAAGDLSGLDEAFSSVATAVAEAASDISGLDESLAGAATTSEEVAAQIEGLNSVIDSMSTTIAEDSTTISELNDTIGNLEGQLTALTGAFASSEEGGGMFGTMLGGLKSGFSDMTEGLGGIGEGLSGFAGGIGNVLGGIGDFADNVFMGAMKLQIFAQMAEQVGSALVGPAINAETMKTAFTTLMGSTKAATDEMEKLDAFASKTPFQTMDIDHAAAQLIGFGINAKDVVPDLTAIGDALSAVGRGSSANLDQIVNIFGKIQLGGKLTVGEMQQFSHDGVNAWAIMEQQTGKTQAQLQKMISAGLIPAGDAIKDLTQGIEKNPLYAGGMAKQSATMAGLVSTLKSNWDQMLSSFASPILQDLEPMVAKLGDSLASPGFKAFATGVGKDISTTFENIGKFVQMNVMPAVNEVVKGLESPGFKNFASGVGKDIEIVFEDIGGFIKNDVTPAISGFIKFLESPSFASFSASIKGIATDMGQMLAPVLKIVGQIFEGLWSVIEKVWPPISEHLMPAVKKLDDAISPLVVTIGTWIAKSGIIPGIFSGIGTVLGIVINVIAGLISGVATVIGWFTHWGDTTKSVGGFFGDLWHTIENFFGGIGQWFHDRLQAVIDSFKWLYDHNYYFKDLVDFIRGIITGVMNWLKDTWKTVQKDAEAAWNTLVQKATELWDNISKPFRDAWSQHIQPAMSTLWNNLSGWAGDLATKALDWGSSVIKGIADGITGAVHFVTDAAGGVADKLKSLLGFHSPTEADLITEVAGEKTEE